MTKTLILLLMVALGVAGILYYRVDVGMGWNDMSGGLAGLLYRVLHYSLLLLVVLACIAYAVTQIAGGAGRPSSRESRASPSDET